jgi:hypothetical protein
MALYVTHFILMLRQLWVRDGRTWCPQIIDSLAVQLRIQRFISRIRRYVWLIYRARTCYIVSEMSGDNTAFFYLASVKGPLGMVCAMIRPQQPYFGVRALPMAKRVIAMRVAFESGLM